jgi:ribose 5-phosphate isomerase B
MKIALGTDHRGFVLKELLKKHASIAGKNIEWIDCGAYDADRSDYPIFADRVCAAMQDKSVDSGILLCGSGVGMSIAANRRAGIFAALAWNQDVARQCKQEDNANVLVLPADFISEAQMLAMVTAWLGATFKGGRYQERIKMIDTDL